MTTKTGQGDEWWSHREETDLKEEARPQQGHTSRCSLSNELQATMSDNWSEQEGKCELREMRQKRSQIYTTDGKTCK